jgi:hypothetical protein
LLLGLLLRAQGSASGSLRSLGSDLLKLSGSRGLPRLPLSCPERGLKLHLLARNLLLLLLLGTSWNGTGELIELLRAQSHVSLLAAVLD